MIVHQTLLPPGWTRPKGYANGVAARGQLVFTAGVVGWDENERFVAKDLAGQLRQVLLNTRAILAEAGAGPEHITTMTWYFTDKQEYLANLREVGKAYREVIGKHFPAMAAVEVTALVEDRAKVEIQAMAVVPD